MDITIETTIQIDGRHLVQDLAAAGIANSGVTPNRMTLTLHGIDPAQEQAARAVVAAHNPEAWSTLDARVKARQTAAEPYARTIPNGWRTWTQAEWTEYYNANISDIEIDKITSLAEAKIFLKRVSRVIDRMAKLEIALRDFNFPSLPEG